MGSRYAAAEQLWGQVGQNFPGVAWSMDCSQKKVRKGCAMITKRTAAPASTSQPLFVIWNGAKFELFTGGGSPNDGSALIQWLQMYGQAWSGPQLETLRQRGHGDGHEQLLRTVDELPPIVDPPQVAVGHQSRGAGEDDGGDDAEEDEEDGDRTVRGIPRVDNPSVGEFRDGWLSSSTPAIVSGSMASWPASQSHSIASTIPALAPCGPHVTIC